MANGPSPSNVMPGEAGIRPSLWPGWIPASAGMTGLIERGPQLSSRASPLARPGTHLHPALAKKLIPALRTARILRSSRRVRRAQGSSWAPEGGGSAPDCRNPSAGSGVVCRLRWPRGGAGVQRPFEKIGMRGRMAVSTVRNGGPPPLRVADRRRLHPETKIEKREAAPICPFALFAHPAAATAAGRSNASIILIWNTNLHPQISSTLCCLALSLEASSCNVSENALGGYYG